MKPSVCTALEMARTALYSQQINIMRDIRDLMDVVDKAYNTDTPADSYIMDQLSERKVKLAETVVARETLYTVEISGL